MNLKFALGVCVLFIGLNTLAAASEVAVQASVYRKLGCGYYSGNYANFQANYQNPELPWGTRVFLHYGFHDRISHLTWLQSGRIELDASAPYTWSAFLEKKDVSWRGSPVFNVFEFAFEILLPDGETYFDNGGKGPMGYYGAIIPFQGECNPGPLLPLEVLTFEQNDPNERR